ncbi:microtubule-associated proteins 1A/1B light chain 3C-like isoform X2 [Condylostylus longicornis]|nr:microtubule-associated proteins 1A/1B light chain 3C-like isoform X2 [Condylostylus longicornis]
MISIDNVRYSISKRMKDQKLDVNANFGPVTLFRSNSSSSSGNNNNNTSINNKIDLNRTNKRDSIKSDEACAIRLRFPNKIPVIVERYSREYDLPYLNKKKFLVPQEITLSQFLTILRNRLKVGSTKALFLLVNDRSLVPLSKTLSEIYHEYRQDDGFLYVTYSSQEVFG